MDLHKVIRVIKSMSTIDPNLRAGDIYSIYYELFDEAFPLKFNIDYEYTYSSKNINFILELRTKIYPQIIDICDLNSKVYLLPMVIDITDRYLLKIFETKQINNYDSAEEKEDFLNIAI
jgi:hypothetical protein